MSDRLQLDTDRLREHGARLAELGDRVGRTHTELRDGLAYAEGCWGDDDLGVAFAEDFKPHADQLLANLRAMQESLHGTAGGMATAAQQVESQDRGAAGLITRSADSEPGVEQPPFSPGWPTGGAGLPASVEPRAPVGPRAAAAPVPPPDTVGRAQPAGRAQPDGGQASSSVGQASPSPVGQRAPVQAPGDPRRPEGSPWRPEGGPRPSVVSPPATDRRGGERSGSGRGPTPSPISAPAAAPNAARAPGSVAPHDPRRSVGAADGKTPWTGRPAAAGHSESPPSPPRPGAVPRNAKGDKDRQEVRDRREPVEAGLLGWLARTLAQRHGVTVVGFDLPGLREAAVREFAAAVDRVLTEYPMIALDVVRVADLGEDATVRWATGPRGYPAAGVEHSITLDLHAACATDRAAEAPVPQPNSEGEPAGELPIYMETLREFGRALDFAGGGVARHKAQKALIAQYLSLRAGRLDTLAAVVAGYRQWRAELIGATGDSGGFDASRAVGAAFATVVRRGDKAGVQARTLYALLVDAAPARV
ncbi:hypothetical protein [Nocardia wallacei]|uniref:hypothetical protein n=1 Tax=Nocardia wallacei TaxID=480035 RepID=UPI002454859E|nr:hypothetical protein [Nocardia wallacei]